MALVANDPVTQLAFSVHENKGVFAVLLGSGVSRAAEIPTGWEITLDLIRRVALAQGVPEQPDWAKWYRDKFGHEPSYSALLAELASSPDERRSILHGYIEPTEQDRSEGRKIPTVAHRAIADLVRSRHIKVIVTTNFDRLMENALREAGIEPTVVSTEDGLLGAQPLSHSSCYILKLHGDYKDARILNTDDELSTYPAPYNKQLDRIFDEHGLIVCGWSGEWDSALRAAFLRAPSRRYPIFWAARSTLQGAAEELVRHRGAHVVTIADANNFFSGIRQRVEVLEQSRRQNPRSIELLVNSTKRYLGNAEYRIQLEELLTDEAEILIELLKSSEFDSQSPLNKETVRARVLRYESASESLSRMVGALGRWGDGAEFPLVLDIMRALYAQSESVQNGYVIWLSMRSYPAVLVFTAYGLGLTRAQRWPVLHKLFSSALTYGNETPTNIVELLFIWAWKGGEKDIWKHLEGLENRKTPLSDHLLDLFVEWGKSFAGLAPDFELLYEKFETLGSLAHFERNDETVLSATNSQPLDRQPVWMPVGRIGWHMGNYRKLVPEMQSEPLKTALLSAGFANGSEKMLDYFIDNLSRYAGRMSW